MDSWLDLHHLRTADLVREAQTSRARRPAARTYPRSTRKDR